MHQARGAGGDAAKLVRIGQYVTNVRLAVLITLLECFSALVLAVTLYGITRDQDHELAMLGLVCRVAEGVLGSLNNIPSYLGLLWLAKAGVGTGAPDIPTTNALRAFLLMPGASVPVTDGLARTGWGQAFHGRAGVRPSILRFRTRRGPERSRLGPMCFPQGFQSLLHGGVAAE